MSVLFLSLYFHWPWRLLQILDAKTLSERLRYIFSHVINLLMLSFVVLKGFFKFLLNFVYSFVFICMGVVLTYIFVHHMHVESTKSRRQCQTPRTVSKDSCKWVMITEK